MAPVIAARLLFLCWIQVTALHYAVCDLPELNLTALSNHAVLGQPFSLQCVLNMNDTGGALIFKRDGFPKCSVERNTYTQYTPGSKTEYSCECTKKIGNVVYYRLDIKKVANETVGPWLCEYQKHSNVINITLSDPEGPVSVTLDTPSALTPTEHQSVNTTCDAHCIPECMFSWKKDYTFVSNDTYGQSLVLEDIRADQGGQYTCTAVNPASGMTGNASLQITVLRAPRLDTSSPFDQKVYTKMGRSASLTVHFLSKPAPAFTWWKIVEGTLTPVPTRDAKDKERRQQVNPGDVLPQRVSTQLDVVVEDEGDLGVFCVTAENEVDKTAVYLELDMERNDNGRADRYHEGDPRYLTWMGIGFGIGAAVMLVISLLVGGLAYRKYSKIKLDLEHPYAKTEPKSCQAENDYVTQVESHYQELPTPMLDRKKLAVNLGDKLTKPDSSHVYQVFKKETVTPRDSGCNSIVIGKSMLNPAYAGFGQYEIPLTTE